MSPRTDFVAPGSSAKSLQPNRYTNRKLVSGWPSLACFLGHSSAKSAMLYSRSSKDTRAPTEQRRKQRCSRMQSLRLWQLSGVVQAVQICVFRFSLLLAECMKDISGFIRLRRLTSEPNHTVTSPCSSHPLHAHDGLLPATMDMSSMKRLSECFYPETLHA